MTPTGRMIPITGIASEESRNWPSYDVVTYVPIEDHAFALLVHQHTLPYWSSAWPKVNALSRAGLVRVRPLNRWIAEVEATDKVLAKTQGQVAVPLIP